MNQFYSDNYMIRKNLLKLTLLVFFLTGSLQTLAQPVSLTSPNGGEVWLSGANQNITWDATSATNIKIEYSPDGGTNWITVVSSTPASTLSYNWTVTTGLSYEGRIRISEVGNPSNLDTSDADFTVHFPLTASPIKILPFGDSITFEDAPGQTPGAGFRNSYRRLLWDSLRTNNYNIDFIGDKSAGYDMFADPENAGIPGINRGDLLNLMSNGWNIEQGVRVTPGPYLATYTPDVILLHIGTNGVDTDPSETTIALMLDSIDNFDEDIWVVLALIIDRVPNIANVTTYNNNVRTMALNRIANGDKIIIADMQNDAGLNYLIDNSVPYDNGDFIDNLHPNDSGYAKMGKLWYPAVKLLMPVSPSTAAPIISAVTDTIVEVNRPYNYDVNASGIGAPEYSLVTSPSGMTIDSLSGVIKWTPSSTGINNVTVRAENSSGNDEESFTINVTSSVNYHSNVISYWRLDETGTPELYKDYPNINDGRSSGSTVPAPVVGIVGGALDFNGSSTEIDVRDDISLFFIDNQTHSFETWIKTTQSSKGMVLSKNNKFPGGGSGTGTFQFGIKNGKAFFLHHVSNVASQRDSITGVTDINDGEWHHIVAIRGAAPATGMQLYVDGVQDVVLNKGFSFNLYTYDPLEIGYSKGFQHFDGLIDEVAIYNAELSASEILDHYIKGKSFGLGYFDEYVFVKAKIFLEGPYDSTANNMSTNLKTAGYIPLTAPYSQSERVLDTIPDGIVDWVNVELRSTSNGSAVATKSALLRNDGTIVSDDGGREEIALLAPPGLYYIVIKHRNHLSVMSATSINLTSDSTTTSFYDFTTDSLKFYGADLGAKKLEDGVWGMIGGNNNNDIVITVSDYNATANQLLELGYKNADHSLNGVVTVSDYNFIANNLLKFSLVP